MILGIIQARQGSTRLPNKTLVEIEGRPLLWHIINRIKSSKLINEIVVATTTNKIDNKLEDWLKNNNLNFYRGSENNVLERFYFAAKQYNPTLIVRITADDPFKDPSIIDSVIEMLLKENLDFAYNNNPPTFPEGLDTEVFTFSSLERAYHESKDPFEQEHVTQYFYRHPEKFKQKNFSYKDNISHLRWTIDKEEDLKMAKEVYNELFHTKNIFLMNDILELLQKKPHIASINSNVERSTMYKQKEK